MVTDLNDIEASDLISLVEQLDQPLNHLDEDSKKIVLSLMTHGLVAGSGDKDVQDVIEALRHKGGTIAYGGRPAGQPQPRPRGG